MKSPEIIVKLKSLSGKICRLDRGASHINLHYYPIDTGLPGLWTHFQVKDNLKNGNWTALKLDGKTICACCNPVEKYLERLL